MKHISGIEYHLQCEPTLDLSEASGDDVKVRFCSIVRFSMSRDQAKSLSTLCQNWEKMWKVVMYHTLTKCGRSVRPLLGCGITMIMLVVFATFRSDVTEMTILVPSPESQYQVPEPDIIEPLRELCASNSWDENLIFSCYGMLVAMTPLLTL